MVYQSTSHRHQQGLLQLSKLSSPSWLLADQMERSSTSIASCKLHFEILAQAYGRNDRYEGEYKQGQAAMGFEPNVLTPGVENVERVPALRRSLAPLDLALEQSHQFAKHAGAYCSHRPGVYDIYWRDCRYLLPYRVLTQTQALHLHLRAVSRPDTCRPTLKDILFPGSLKCGFAVVRAKFRRIFGSRRLRRVARIE